MKLRTNVGETSCGRPAPMPPTKSEVNGFRSLHYLAISALFGMLACFMSCSHTDNDSTFRIERSAQAKETKLLTWSMIGSFSAQEDSSLNKGFISCISMWDSLSTSVRQDTLHFSGTFSPSYNQVDFHEVYGVKDTDTTGILDGRYTYTLCNFRSEEDTTVYLDLESAMSHSVWLDGMPVQRKDIQGLNVFALPIKQGDNGLVIRFLTQGGDMSFEATVSDSVTIVRKYADGQSGNVMYAIVNDSKDILLTNGHQNMADAEVAISVSDASGGIVKRFMLEKDKYVYPVHEMEWGRSYLCEMAMAGRTVRQPILCGNADNALQHFKEEYSNLPESCSRRPEIKELLFRLEFLLNHSSRYQGDWWWQFKIPNVTYQIERAMADIGGRYGTLPHHPRFLSTP